MKMNLFYGFSTLLLIAVHSVNAEPHNQTNVQDIMAAKEASNNMFARIDGREISDQIFNTEFYQHMQSRFYHGKPPESQIEEVRQQVAKTIITRVLLLNEANRQNLACDQQHIEEMIKQYDVRYKSSERWQQNRESLVKTLRTRLCENDQLNQIEISVRNISDPTARQLRSYYESNIDKFTEPARQRISVILLGVDPAAPKSSWDAALAEAKSIKLDIKQGEDFAEIASLRSSDKSAQAGGDMGYLHKGMLSPAAEDAITKLTINEISEPVRLLEGIALLRVTERLPARVRSYDDVKSRLHELWIRDTSNMAWEDYKNKLWSGANIEIYDQKLSARMN